MSEQVYEPEILLVVDQDGNEHELEVLGEFEIESGERSGNKYVILAELGDDEVDEVYVYRVEGDDEENLILSEITDDEEWNIVEEVINMMVEDED